MLFEIEGPWILPPSFRVVGQKSKRSLRYYPREIILLLDNHHALRGLIIYLGLKGPTGTL